MSAVAGWVIDHYGIAAGFALGALLALPCLPLTWQLHTMSSAKQHHQPALPCSAGQDLHGMKEQTSVAPGQRKRHGGYAALPAAEAADAASSGVAQSVDVKALHGSGLRSALQGNVTLGDLTLACRTGVYGSDAGDSPAAAALAHLHYRYPYEQAAAGSSQAAQGLVGTSHLPTDPLDVDDIPDAEASHAESACLLPTLHEHRASALIEPAVPPDSTRGTSTSAPSLNEKAWLLLSRPTVVAFLWTGVVMGAGFGVIDTYLFLLLQQLGANDTLMGLTLTVTCMAEVPAFQLQGKLLAWAGVQRVLDLAQVGGKHVGLLPGCWHTRQCTCVFDVHSCAHIYTSCVCLVGETAALHLEEFMVTTLLCTEPVSRSRACRSQLLSPVRSEVENACMPSPCHMPTLQMQFPMQTYIRVCMHHFTSAGNIRAANAALLYAATAPQPLVGAACGGIAWHHIRMRLGGRDSVLQAAGTSWASGYHARCGC